METIEKRAAQVNVLRSFLTLYSALFTYLVYCQSTIELVSSFYDEHQTAHLGLSAFIIHDSISTTELKHGEPVYFKMPKNVIEDLSAERNNSISIHLPLFGDEESQLRLIRYAPYSQDFEARLASSSTDLVLNSERGIFYRGTVDDRDNCWATLSIYNGSVRLLIITPEGNYNFGLNKGSQDLYVLINDRQLGGLPWLCHANDETTHSLQRFEQVKPRIQRSCTTIECYWVADYDFFVLHQFNPTWTLNSIIALFNEMSALYAQEGISISLANVLIYNLPDLYDEVNVLNAYNAFGWDLHNNDPYFNQDLGMLVSYAWNGQLAGLATIDALCTDYNAFVNPTRGRFSYSRVNDYYLNFPAYSWSLAVVAHETGHNLGSRHTHWCGWPGGPIDGCEAPEPDNYGFPCSPGPIPPNGGTLMSYCHNNYFTNLALGFGSLPLTAVIQEIQEAEGDCLCPATSILESNLTSDAKLQIFPNPVQDVLNISGYIAENLVVSIYDNSGRILMVSYSTSIDVSELKTGLYFVLIESPNQSLQTMPFLKQ